MTEDRRTKAQIVAELESANKTIVDLQARIAPEPSFVPVASALAGCIRALDALPRKRSSNLYGNLDGGEPDKGEVANILRHLMSRYGVDLTVHTVEPCQRVHLDDAADDVLIDRLRGRF
ncbi:hypothetical protein [Microbacterium maritypicum]|uniref:hypothetical protein n=1 Tax=Microbacterium maritypicum TaxID=33918 RepID=UPI003A93BA4F